MRTADMRQQFISPFFVSPGMGWPLSSGRSDPTPPVDTNVARRVGEAKQEIAVAGSRRAKADEIAPTEFVERLQQFMLNGEPTLVLQNHSRTIAIRSYPERIAPFRAATNVDRSCRHAGMVLIENSAHRSSLLLL